MLLFKLCRFSIRVKPFHIFHGNGIVLFHIQNFLFDTKIDFYPQRLNRVLMFSNKACRMMEVFSRSCSYYNLHLIIESIPGLADSVVAGRQATAEPPR